MSDGATIEIVRYGVPPSWKRRIVTKRRDGTLAHVNPSDYEAVRQEFAMRMLAAVRSRQALFLASRVSLWLDLSYPDRRVRDADRALNLVLDAGRGILWPDDAWTTFEGGEIIVRPKLDPASPMVRLRVQVIGPRVAGAPTDVRRLAGRAGRVRR